MHVALCSRETGCGDILSVEVFSPRAVSQNHFGAPPGIYFMGGRPVSVKSCGTVRKKLWKNLDNWIAAILAAAAFFLALAAIHDMQTAEGVGLYFALKRGSDRLPYDLAADAVAAFGLLIAILVPAFVLRHKGIASIYRLLAAFLAFMPRLSMAYLLDPFSADTEFSIEGILPVLQTIAPLVCVLAPALCLAGRSASAGEGTQAGASASAGEVAQAGGRENVWRRWYSLCGLAAALMLAAALIFPALQQLCSFLLSYLLLLVCFDLWERLYARYPALNRWGWILFGGLGFRAVYVLAEVMRRF